MIKNPTKNQNLLTDSQKKTKTCELLSPGSMLDIQNLVKSTQFENGPYNKKERPESDSETLFLINETLGAGTGTGPSERNDNDDPLAFL